MKWHCAYAWGGWAVGAAFAYSAPPGVPSEFIAPASTHVRESSGVVYLSGGVGREEQRQMLSQATRFPVRLVFSTPGGKPAAVREITIRGGRGLAFTAQDVGPWLMLALPPGRYTLTARFDGFQRERILKVGTGVQRFAWVVPAALRESSRRDPKKEPTPRGGLQVLRKDVVGTVANMSLRMTLGNKVTDQPSPEQGGRHSKCPSFW